MQLYGRFCLVISPELVEVSYPRPIEIVLVYATLLQSPIEIVLVYATLLQSHLAVSIEY